MVWNAGVLGGGCHSLLPPKGRTAEGEREGEVKRREEREREGAWLLYMYTYVCSRLVCVDTLFFCSAPKRNCPGKKVNWGERERGGRERKEGGRSETHADAHARKGRQGGGKERKKEEVRRKSRADLV